MAENNDINEMLYGSEYKQEIIKAQNPDKDVIFYRDANNRMICRMSPKVKELTKKTKK